MPVQSGDQTLEVEGHAQQGLEDHTSQQVLVEGLAAIMFEVRDAVDPIEVGGETVYEIRVVNQGTKAATNVQIVVGLPPGMKATSADGETRHAIQAGGVVFEPISQLAPKADSVFRVHVQGVRPGDQRGDGGGEQRRLRPADPQGRKHPGVRRSVVAVSRQPIGILGGRCPPYVGLARRSRP